MKRGLLMALCATGLVLATPGMAQETVAPSGITVMTTTPDPRAFYLEERVFIGRIEASQTSGTGFEIPGQLASVQVDEGDVVSAGDVLARLDTQRLRAQRREAAAALAEAEASLSLSETTFQRTERAVSIKAVSAQELDEARENRNTAAATVNRRRAALDRIDVDISKSTLRAAFDGVVIGRMADEGRVISAGTPVLMIQETGLPEARISLANGMADKFGIGDVVFLEGHGKSLPAAVKAILPVRDTRTRTVDVIFTIQQIAGVRPGDIVEITLEREVKKPGFWVPLSALTETVRGLWSVYAIAPDSTTRRTVVDLVYQNEDRAFVRGNLHPADQIVADGVHRIVPGQLVTLAEK